MEKLAFIKNSPASLRRLEALRSFFVSKTFMLLCLLLGCITTVAHIEFYTIIALVGVMALIFLVCDELIATLMPFMTLCLVAIKCFNSFDTYIKVVWIGFIAVAVLLLRFILYWRPIKFGKLLWPQVAVSAAVLLGGVGKISAKEYFSLTSVYYMLGLSLAMLLIYIIASTYYTPGGKVDVKETFARVMYYICALACFMVLSYYAVNIKAVIGSGSVIEPQWRNNVSTFMMLTMPFAFYRSIKHPHCIWIGYLTLPCFLLTSSRSGLIFGTVEFVICCVYILHADKRGRKRNTAVMALMLIAVILFARDISDFIGKTLSRFETMGDEPRAGLMRRAVEDFKSNPVFGRGIGYMGNRDIHPSKKFAACWYHSSPFQIIGSFGLVGVAAFGYQFILRCKTYFKNVNLYNSAVFIGYIGILMMSLVNPGEFSPLPYELMVVIYFALIEQTKDETKSLG